MSDQMWLELNLQVQRGSFSLSLQGLLGCRTTGVLGPSGSGKTTFLEALVGLCPEATGRIRFQGEVFLDSASGLNLSTEQRGIGYVPQDHRLFPHWNARANLLAGSRRAEAKGQDVTILLRRVAQVLELTDLLEQPVQTLSGGQRQRVALGRALCSGPRALLLDEPLASLDDPLRHRVLPFLIRIRESFDIPLVIVSHNPIELQALCEEILVLRDGELLAQGPTVKTLTSKEVYALAASSGFENLSSAVFDSGNSSSSTARLGKGGKGPVVILPPLEYPKGTPLLLGIPAKDLMVATGEVGNLSARNRILSLIEEIRPAQSGYLLMASIKGMVNAAPWAVELTQEAIRDLALDRGKEISLIFKSTAVKVYG